jgi:hypothetical protein
MLKKNKLIFIFLLVILAFSFCSCSYVQKRVDISGLHDLASEITTDFNPGSPQDLQAYVCSVSLEKDTEPIFQQSMQVSTLMPAKWQIKHPSGDHLIMEKITFPSMIQHKNRTDTAVFYVYRTGKLKQKKVMLWIPGAGVSDFAFGFIKKFFFEELSRHYNIVFYVPPYHLERTEAGKDNGAGLFTSDNEKNISVLLNSVRELRTMIHYLKSKGVTRMGGWGGSIGATMLLLTAQVEEFDHVSLMIPVIDLETVFFKNDYMSDVVRRFEKAGFNPALLAQAYAVVNPVMYSLKMNPDRVQIMYAEYDQLTQESETIAFAQVNKISNIIAYPRSHATILLISKIYKDHGLFLDSLDGIK